MVDGNIGPDETLDINPLAVPPAHITPNEPPVILAPTMPAMNIDTLASMVAADVAFFIPMGIPQLQMSDEGKAKIEQLRADFNKFASQLDSYRHDIISSMWDSYQETLEEIGEAKKRAAQEKVLAAEALKYDDLRDELSLIGILAVKVLMDFVALRLSFDLQKAELAKDPEKLTALFQMAVGGMILQEMRNPAFVNRIRQDFIKRLDNHMAGPMTAQEQSGITDKWMAFIQVQMAFVAVACFSNLSDLLGKEEVTSSDIHDLPLKGKGDEAMAYFKEMEENLLQYVTPEELNAYLKDMTESLYLLKGSDNALNQVVAYLNIFGFDAGAGGTPLSV